MTVDVTRYSAEYDSFLLFPLLAFEWAGAWGHDFEIHVGWFFWSWTIGFQKSRKT